MTNQRIITYAEAIRESLDQAMAARPEVFLIGEGVPDPKGIFGTTLGLRAKYGVQRVMDMPVAENGLTGVCIGAALRGLRPVMVHQRVDFVLLALDQIINNAAKWHFMFGGQSSVPLVVRLIIGCGWGQGAQHSQSLQALFAHIPGLKVIMPTTAYDAKGMLTAAIEDPNPVIMLEHRWLHGIKDHVPQDPYTVPIGKANVLREGKDVTIVSMSYMTVEALKAVSVLQKNGVQAELIDVRSIKPLDMGTIIRSVTKTGRLIVVDSAWITGGVAGEIVAGTVEHCFKHLKSAPQRIALPDIPTPSAPALTRNFYPTHQTIIQAAMAMVGQDAARISAALKSLGQDEKPHDVPDAAFTGPF